MDFNTIKEKSATTQKYQKCPKNPNKNPIKPDSIKRLKNYKIKLSNSKNSESKKKATTKMDPKHSQIKLKLKNITLISLKHVLLSSIMTKIISKKILKMLKTRSIYTKKKLILSTDLLKNQQRPTKFKK